MSLFRPGAYYCVRCSYKHLLLYLSGFYFILIIMWTIFTHYSNIFESKPDLHHFLISKTKINPVNTKRNANTIHTMYSVGCDSMVMWQLQQSVTLDYSWYNINQTGHLTRIVSGCGYAPNNIRKMSQTSIPMKPDIHFLDNKDLVNQCLSHYNTNTSFPSNTIFKLNWNWQQRFHIIFVPSFDDIKKQYPTLFGQNIQRYPQLNRILALYIIYHCTEYKNIQQNYMMMLDPDFVFLKSLNRYNLALNKPIAGKYGLGNKWVRWLKEAGHVIESNIDSNKDYEGGVPYLLHNNDWYNILPIWISWMSFAYTKYNGIESDMYAYMISAYKLGLKHVLIEEFNPSCMKSMDQNIHPFDDNSVFLHYCSSYKVDLSEFKDIVQKIEDPIYTFNKHWTKARRNRNTKQQQLWMIECESPVLIEIPTIDRFERYDNDKKSNRDYRKAYKQYQIVRTIVPMFNNALIAFKEKNCENKTLINRDKKIITHEAVLTNGDILFHIVDDI
eukprot:275689_1